MFAKIRGHPVWPAKINNMEKKGRSIIYQVIFFGTKEYGNCHQNELEFYSENKSKYMQGKLMNNKNFVLALKEIENEIGKKKTKNNNSRTSIENGSLTFQASTPVLTKSNHTSKSGETTLVEDKAVNTPEYFDLDFKIKALTDKCISLEQSVIEKDEIINSKSTPVQELHLEKDFQTQILLDELKKFKLETENLKTVIICLEKDKDDLITQLREENKTNISVQNATQQLAFQMALAIRI